MTVELFRGDKKMQTAALALWQRVFGDPPEMISAFFACAPFDHACFMAVSEDTLAGMLFSLPAVFRMGSSAYESRYIYAVATDPAFRGQGVMTALEKYACKTAEKEKVQFLALVPANRRLFSMYQKLGYQTYFFHGTEQIPRRLNPKAELSSCEAEDFIDLREKYLSLHSASFELCPALCRFRYEDFLRSGGEILLAHTACGSGYLAFEQDGNTLYIRETSLFGDALSHAAGVLCEKTGAVRILTEGVYGKQRRYGMIKPIGIKERRKMPIKIDGYMNLMLN